MKKSSLTSSLALFALAAVSLFGCKKKMDTINNSQVIATPYSLYFTDTAGVLFNTNDGLSRKVVFSSDGFPSRAICNSGENLIWVKPTLYRSTNNGRNFNYAYDSVTSINMSAVNGRQFDLNQSMVIYVPSFNNNVYITSNDPSPKNFFGIAWNGSGGVIGSWIPESYYDTVQVTNPSNINVTSFTQVKSGKLMAWDGIHKRMLYRNDVNSRWMESFVATGLPDTAQSFFSLGHINERLVLIDQKGRNGAWYSDDYGVNWVQYTGLPANTPLMSVCSPFEQLCLVGTDSAGLYVVNPNVNSFQPSNLGLGENTVVRGIAYKQNIYKNGNKQKLVYLATNRGIFQSMDMGNTWVMTIPGNYVQVY